MTDSSAVGVDQDAEQLKALGYVSHFDRTMSKWENFSLGFTYLSPVVGVYTIFASAFVAGGPPMWWTYMLVGLGQLMVCLVFGEIVSQFPISGGLYPWARRLIGKRWAWMAGWVYAWALCCTMAGRGHRRGAVSRATVRRRQHSRRDHHHCACAHRHDHFSEPERDPPAGAGGDVRLHLRTGRGHRGRRLPTVVRAASAAQVLLDTSLVPTHGSYWPAFLASSLAAMFCYYGFEACGDVAEETPNASRMIPKAMRMTIYIGGAAATWVCLAFVLSIPDIGAVMSGKDKDPIVTLLRSAMGEAGFRAVIVVVLVSFISCLLSLQAAASRLIFAYARDQMIFGSKYLSRMSPGPPCSCHGADRDGRDSGA